MGPVTTRVGLTLTGTVLLVGAVTSACGGGGAPTDASEDEFCTAQTSLLEDLVPDDPEATGLPSGEDVAAAVEDWVAELEDVGTPEAIPDEARAGFEAMVEEARDVDAADFDFDALEELRLGAADASEEARQQARAFSEYVAETCGNPLDDLELPELPQMQ